MRDETTIVALSSGSLPAGVAVIRISGPAAPVLLAEVAGELPEPRRLRLRSLRVAGEAVDSGLIAWFPGPGSFTGEDSAELQVHGSPAVVRALLRHLTSFSGVRLAEAGEFTRRAFLNGKLDLTAVEGLGDLLQAETESQRRQAVARAAGGVLQRVAGWRAALIDLRAEIEARLDFSDEGDVAEALPLRVVEQLHALAIDLRDALESISRGRIVREGLRVALAGPPNAGKSSLLNALARSDVAIVTDEAGTTRDVREVQIDLGGQLVTLIDMAGLREASSKAEREGVRRAGEEIARADLVLQLSAPDVPAIAVPETDAPVWPIASKADLGRAGEGLALSVQTGEGLSLLVERLSAFASEMAGQGETVLLSRERDRENIAAALSAVTEAQSLLEHSELAAEALRRASHALERLVGRIDAENVLDRLFSAFCIGK